MNQQLPHPSTPLFRIDSDRCVNCAVPVCTKVCPVSAVSGNSGNAYRIDPNRCIGCGDCLVYCPNDAVKFRNSIDEVKNLIAGHKTVALLDPSISGEFEDITDYRKFVAMIKSLGFSNVHEVAFGVDMIAEKYNDLINNYQGKYYIFSTCPAVVNYVRKFHPDLIDNLVPFVSPSIAMAKYLRNKYDKDTKFVFVGPCIASKDEEFYNEEKYIDANITFRELRQMFNESDIQELKVKFDDFDEPYGNRGARYPLVDGLLYAAECEDSPVFSMAAGRKSLDAVKTFANEINKVKKHFNLIYCRCCSLGPGTTGGNFIMSDNAVRNYEKKRCEMLNIDLWRKWLKDTSNVDLKTSFVVDDQRTPEPAKEKVEEVLDRIGHNTNGCRLCGFNSCFDFATNVAKGHVDISDCTFYDVENREKLLANLEKEKEQLMAERDRFHENEIKLHESVERLDTEAQLMNILLDNLNSAVVVVDSELSIVKTNSVFVNMLGEDAAEIAEVIPELVGAAFNALMPQQVVDLFNNVLNANKVISNKDIIIDGKFYNISIFPIGEGRMAGGIFRDMHSAGIQKEQIIKKINDVIDENLEMVQKIGFLLGEGASQTEKMLNSVINSYKIIGGKGEDNK